MESHATESCDVTVVGAGPVGLSLALYLANRGHAVTIFEKKSKLSQHSRAPAIWPRTQEILDDLGFIESFLEEGISVSTLELWDVDRNKTLFSAPLEKLANVTRHPRLLVLPQSRTEHLLCEAVQRHPKAALHFGKEVVAIHNRSDGAEVVYHTADGPVTQQSRFAIGCDGAHSLTRDAIDSKLEGITYDIEAALVDVSIEGSKDLPFPRITTQDAFAVGIRLQDTLWRLILPYSAKNSMPLEERTRLAAHSLFDRPYQTVWQSEFRLHRRVGSRFAKGNIFLAGDAAHLNSPVGGQGMNSGIQDAEALGAALDKALRLGDCGALEAYASKRPDLTRRGVNRFTDYLTQVLFFRNGRLFRPILRAANLAMRISTIQRKMLTRIAMLSDPR